MAIRPLENPTLGRKEVDDSLDESRDTDHARGGSDMVGVGESGTEEEQTSQ